MAHYESVNNVARKVTKRYEPVNNVARKVVKGYESVGNVARLFFNALPYTVNFWLRGATSSSTRTLYEYYRGIQDGIWRFYLDSEGATTDTNNPMSCVADIEGDLGGKTITVTCKGFNNGSSSGSIDVIKLISKVNGTWETFGSNCIVNGLDSEEYKTHTITLGTEVEAVRIGVWQSSQGRSQIELFVNSFTIDGVELV